MGTGRSSKDNLKHVDRTKKLATALARIVPGTREYGVLLVKALKKEYPRGYMFVIKMNDLTNRKLVTVYLNQNYLFMIWLKMMMWCEGNMSLASKELKGTT